MKKSKSFTQYSSDSFSISVKIGINGDVRQKNILNFYGKQTKEREREKYKNNKEHIKIISSKWYKNNKNKISEQKKIYRKSDKGKESIRKSHAKRRGFGLNPLNNPFKNCEGHHLNYEDVIYIPKKLHRSIWHSITKNINMHEINNLAIDYYWKEKIKNMEK